MADLLRFITCGSVDDGKSTLIGRLLFEAGGLPEDTLRKLDADSRVHGTQGEATDFALLVDGLSAEREQGITIDVAYRFFATPKRAFIVADTPGHEQYTRNMATGASTADLAILLVDARKGLLAQTRRHALICSLLGVRHMVLAVNKMDLVDHSRAVFEAIGADFTAFARDLGLASLQPIPMSALSGGNLTRRDNAMFWYDGPVLLEWLEQVARKPEASAAVQDEAPLRLPIQSVIRPDPDFRGFAGTIRAGTLRPGDGVRVLPSGQRARIARIAAPSGDRPVARAGEAVLVTLDGEVDVSRGDWLVADAAPAEIADQFQAMLIWMSDAPLLPGRSYIMKSAAGEANLQVTELRHRVDIATGAHESARTLALNEIGLANISLDRAIAFEPYTASRDLGGFIVIDRVSQDTVGAGLIRHPLRRSANIHTQALSVDAAARSRLKGHRPAVLWFTGLSGSGKSTLANRLDTVLNAQGCHTAILDGDNVRHGLNRDLGFTDADRVENIRRVAEVARLMADAGLIVLVSFISPFRQERALARTRIGPAQFYEIFVDAPLAVAEARDPKGLYAKARAGRLANFTGVDSPYEAPETPDLHLRTDRLDPDGAIALILQRLRRDGVTA